MVSIVEEASLIAGMLGIGRGSAARVEAEAASRPCRHRDSIGILAADLLTLQEFRHRLHLLPGLGTPQSVVLPASFQALARARP